MFNTIGELLTNTIWQVDVGVVARKSPYSDYMPFYTWVNGGNPEGRNTIRNKYKDSTLNNRIQSNRKVQNLVAFSYSSVIKIWSIKWEGGIPGVHDFA